MELNPDVVDRRALRDRDVGPAHADVAIAASVIQFEVRTGQVHVEWARDSLFSVVVVTGDALRKRATAAARRRDVDRRATRNRAGILGDVDAVDLVIGLADPQV